MWGTGVTSQQTVEIFFWLERRELETAWGDVPIRIIDPDGAIWFYESSDELAAFASRVSDDGLGFPTDLDFRNTESLGLQLVNILIKQLEGTIELDRSSGTAFKITFAELK